MHSLSRSTFAIALTFFLTLIAATSAQQKEKSAIDLFPDSSIAVLTIPNTQEVITTVLTHPLREEIESIEDVKQSLRSPEMRQLNVIKRVVEYQLEMKWEEAIGQLTSQGLYGVFDKDTNGFAFIAHSKDAKTLETMVSKLIELFSDSKKMGLDAKIESTKFRGLQVYSVQNVIFALLDDKLLIATDQNLAKEIGERFLDGGDDSLSKAGFYVKSKSLVKSKADANLVLDLKHVREIGNFKKLVTQKAENIGVELLIGGILDNLKNAEQAVANFEIDQEHLQLTFSTPHDSKWETKAREFFFGPQGQGTAPNLLVPEQEMFTITSYRDVGQLWLSKEDLFEEAHIAELTQVDSQFSTIFSGLDFGEEVLGALKPGVQIVGALQDFSKLKTPSPEIELPSFAAIFKLKEPEKIQQRFKVGFQSVIGFTNIALAQQGQPQLDLETEKSDKAKIVTTTYMADERSDKGLLNYNFSPSVAFVDDYFIVSSTDQLARELVEIAGKKAAKTPAHVNTSIRIQGKTLTRILGNNRDSLIAQQMIEEGIDEEQASKQIDVFLSLLKYAKDASFNLHRHDDRIDASLELNFEKVKK